jgi:hypothetical protein
VLFDGFVAVTTCCDIIDTTLEVLWPLFTVSFVVAAVVFGAVGCCAFGIADEVAEAAAAAAVCFLLARCLGVFLPGGVATVLLFPVVSSLLFAAAAVAVMTATACCD